MGKVEEGGQHEDEEAAGKPGVKPESLEKREHASEVSTGKIYEEFVPKDIFLKKIISLLISLRSVIENDREVRHLSSFVVGIEVCHAYVHLVSLNHSNLYYELNIFFGSILRELTMPLKCPSACLAPHPPSME